MARILTFSNAAAACAVAGLWAASAVAIGAATPARADQPDLISFGMDSFDTVVREDRGNAVRSLNVRVDYRSGTNLLPFMEPFATVRPWGGVMANSDGGLWGGGGVLLDIPIGNFYVMPSTGVGLWHNGGSRDLGSTIEFRTTLEIGYRFESEMRVSAYASHISNAGIGNDNPGADMLGAYLHVPLASLAKAF